MTNPYSFSNLTYDIGGASNYWVPIYSQFNEEKHAAHIWSLDTGAFNCTPSKEWTYGCIQPDQVFYLICKILY